MSFAYSGGVITQTGTDTDLSGLSGISGVTTRVNAGDPKIQYIIDTGYRLVVDGTLSWSNRTEELIITSATPALTSGGMMRVNGTVTIGTFAVIGNNGNNGFYRAEGLRIALSTSAGFPYAVDDVALFVSSTGTFNAYGSGLFLGNGVTLEAGASGIIKGCFIDATSNQRFKMYSSTFSVDDSDWSVLSPFIFNPPASFKGNTLNDMEITGYGTLDLTNLVTLEDFNNTYSSAREIKMIDQFRLELLNANVGANVQLQGWGTTLGGSRNEYYAEITKQIDFKAINDTGANVEDVKLYAKDTDNGARTNLYIDNTADKIYTATSDVNGDVARQKIVLFIADNTDLAQGINYPSNPDYRTKGDNLNTFDFNFMQYNYNLAGLPDYDVSQNGVASTTVGFLPDALITQATKATVEAYTTIDDALELYDRAKSYLYDNFVGESVTIIGRAGSQAVLVDVDLVLDATAVSAFAFDGSTITAKSSTFTGGATATTGGVTTQNGTLLDGGTFDCDISYDSGAGTTIKDVTCTGTVDFTTAGTYNLVGTNIDTVTNSSGGAVTLELDVNSTVTTNTGPNITINAPTGSIQFTNLVAGSQVVVFQTGTQTESFRTNSSGTSENVTPLTTGTYDYTVMKAGYLPIRVVGVVITSLPVPASISQAEDRAYVASSGLTYGTTATLVGTDFAVTTATTVQNWYSAWIEFWIAESALTNKAFPLSPFGSASFSLNIDHEFTAGSIQYLSRDGFRYVSTGEVVTASFCAILSQGVVAGSQVKYYFDAGSVQKAQATGNMDEVLQYFGDATHGNFDYSTILDVKVQTNGYRQAETSVTTTYGTLEETLYVISLPQLAIDGLTLGDPGITGVSLTDDSASPISWDAGDGLKDYSITLTDTNSNTGEDILRWLNYNLSLDATFQGKDPFFWPEIVLDNGPAYETLLGEIHDPGGDVDAGARVIDGSSDPHADFTRFQSDDGSYGTSPVLATASITNLVANSRIQIYNVTTATEIVNAINAGTSYSLQYTDGVGYSDGDSVRVRITYVSGVTAKVEFTQSTVATTNGWSIAADQVDCQVYNTLAIDGSTIVDFTADYIADEVDVVVSGAFRADEWFAWWKYTLYTEAGIREFFGGVSAIDIANFKINNDTIDIKFDNATTAEAFQNDNRRVYRNDGLRPVKNPTTSGFGVDIEWREPVLIAETGVSGLTPAESIKLLSLDTTNLDVAISTRSDFDSTTDEVITDSASRTASQADVSGLSTFDASTDEVDLKNNAITSNKVANNAFNNSAFTTGFFNAINGEVDTALGDYDAPTKAEMDSAFASLNDLSTADIDARLTAYGLPTLTEMTSAFTEIKGAGWTSTDTLENISDNASSLDEGELHTALNNYANKDDYKADVSGLATQVSVSGLNDLSTSDIDARLANYDGPTNAEMVAEFNDLKGAGWTSTDTLENIKDSITTSTLTATDVWTFGGARGLTEDVTTDTDSRNASKADVSILDTLLKYHDNNVKYFDSDGTTEVLQYLAYRMVVYDDDGTTPLKTILFKDSNGDPSTISNSTRYEKL